MGTELPILTKKDFQSDQEVRWCPGCGDYAILSALQQVLAGLGVDKERLVIVSGIGCSSRFPYYMNTYGFHTIHGRAPAIATGLKTARPDLDVWVVTGDGDALSIGGNHLIHTLRRNVGIKILLFNNRIYGLTKGQYSPTSEVGKRTKSSPFGSLDNPFNPLSIALAAGASFVARAVDVFVPHLRGVLERVAAHRGSAFVEIYQDCNIFNHEAFFYMTKKDQREDATLYLDHGQPLVYGKEKDRGLRLDPHTLALETVELGEGGPGECVVWDEQRTDPALAFMLAQLGAPDFPTPVGVLRAVEMPTYENAVAEQIAAQQERLGEGTLAELLTAGDTWTVKEDGTVVR